MIKEGKFGCPFCKVIPFLFEDKREWEVEDNFRDTLAHEEILLQRDH